MIYMKRYRFIITTLSLLAVFGWVNHQPAMASSVSKTAFAEEAGECHGISDSDSMPKSTMKLCCIATTDITEVVPTMFNVSHVSFVALPTNVSLIVKNDFSIDPRVNTNPPNHTLFNLHTIIKRE